MFNQAGSLTNIKLPKNVFVYKYYNNEVIIVPEPICKVAERLAAVTVGNGYSFLKYNPDVYNVDVIYPNGGMVNYTVKREVTSDVGGQHIRRIYYINNISKTERDIFCLQLSRELITYV